MTGAQCKKFIRILFSFGTSFVGKRDTALDLQTAFSFDSPQAQKT